MQYSLLEVVQLQQDFPNLSLFRGATGTIVDTYMDLMKHTRWNFVMIGE